jgi:hypothetical protein
LLLRLIAENLGDHATSLVYRQCIACGIEEVHGMAENVIPEDGDANRSQGLKEAYVTLPTRLVLKVYELAFSVWIVSHGSGAPPFSR